MSDTGNSEAAFPYQSVAQSNPPYGNTFFGRPANRFSDGRVVLDFFAQALKIPLLSPYLQSVGYDFSHGANFAFAGVTTQNITYPATVTAPFYYWVQTKQFQLFKERTLALWTIASSRKGAQRSYVKLLTKPKHFQTALYFTTFGANDFIVPLFRLGLSIQQVQSNVSIISNAMVQNTEELYNQGARTLMVFNVPPLGCYPAFLASPRIRNMSTVDPHGCLATVNEAVETTNSLIRSGLKDLRSKHPDATIIYADLYTILKDLIVNGTSYGFKETFKACCGAGGGAYNLNPNVSCGLSALVNGQLIQGTSCSDPGSYVNWDGVHVTDAAASFIARAVLQGKHTEPVYKLTELCRLSFEQFSPSPP